MIAPLRVHISPVGFDFERVIDPLLKMKADKVYLVTYQHNDKAQTYINKIVDKLSKNTSVDIKDSYFDMWDFYESIEKFRKIILDETGNNIYINISTGTKITAIAGMLSCMLWNAEPYYVKLDYPSDNLPLISQKVIDTTMLPKYSIKKPDNRFLTILSMLHEEESGTLRKVKLISKLENLGIIRKRDDTRTEFTATAKHSQLKALLDPMQYEWNYIIVTTYGKRSEVSITPQGENALKIFGSPPQITSN